MKQLFYIITLILSMSTLSLHAQYKFEAWNDEKYKTANSAADVPYMSDIEKEVLKVMNYARLNGKLFAETYVKKYAELKGKENLKQVKSLIVDLNKTKVLEVYKPNAGLVKAAKSHADYMGKKGEIGHFGKGGKDPAQRIEEHVNWDIWVAENIQYGVFDPAEIVIALLIDEKVPNLGHRKNILEQRGRYVGIAIAPHKTYTTNCVMEFTGGIR
jgi:uncharacterized protein YkwD